MATSEKARETATAWLIEHNHHACHLTCDPEDGKREDGPVPYPGDVDDLADLVESERARIVAWMRREYPQNRHALEWALAIERREDD